ncbi:hypothetical protein F4859DRAFT_468158 [Xylaria cf. heliscus]|nr:hypothetical protein F4859DRAFT_468158 [Xylaria cf. heliscus]
MHELIEAAFLHVDVIGPEVHRGRYDLVGPDGTIILPQTWDEIIQPGWNISMHMWPIEPPEPPQPPELNLPAGGLSPPPAPPDQSTTEGITIVEPDEVRSSGDQMGDEESSGYGSSIGSWRPSRARRIANAFSALKSSIFRRRRRSSLSTSASSSGSEEIDD